MYYFHKHGRITNGLDELDELVLRYYANEFLKSNDYALNQSYVIFTRNGIPFMGYVNTLSSNPTIKLVADVLAYPYKQVSFQFVTHKRKINL